VLKNLPKGKAIVEDDSESGSIRIKVKYKDMPMLFSHLKKIGVIIKLPTTTKALMDFYTDEKKR